MEINRRKHKRFSATAFLNVPVVVSPIAPYFGRVLKGKLIDLSSGGMALLIDELIPQGSKLDLMLRFPDQSELQTLVDIKHVFPRGRKYLHGLEFLTIPDYMVKKIESMSSAYIDCENRIQHGENEICVANCSFFNMCTKKERRSPTFNVDIALELAFQTLQEKDFPLKKPQ